MSIYTIVMEEDNVLRLGFGDAPAQNDALVKDATQQMSELIDGRIIRGGELIKLNGPATLPIAFVLAHKLNHLYQAVAVYDPKLSKYVVVIAHGGKYSVGDLVD